MDGGDAYPAAAPVDETWWATVAAALSADRQLVQATIRPDCVSITLNAQATFRYLTPHLVGVLSDAGLSIAVDNGVVMSPDRAVTRPIGNVLSEWRRQHPQPVSGITYMSRVDHTVTCEALFGAYPLLRASVEICDIDRDDVIRVGLRLSGVTTL